MTRERSAQRRLPTVRVRSRTRLPLLSGQDCFDAEIVTFTGLPGDAEHVALVFGDIAGVPLVRVHSECLTGDVFGSARCDCGPQLDEAIRRMTRSGGIIVYLRQEGRGIGLYNKLDAYRLQDELGLDTFAANRHLNFDEDPRDYSPAARVLQAMDVTEIRLLTNNPDKVGQLVASGIVVRQIVPTGVFLTATNHGYLRAKAELAGHTLRVNGEGL